MLKNEFYAIYIYTQKDDKGSCIVIWGRNDYFMTAEKQLSDNKVYQEVTNSENILPKQK